MKKSINYTKYIPYKAGVIIDTYKIAEFLEELTWGAMTTDEIMEYLSMNIEVILKDIGYINDVDFLSSKDIETFKNDIFPQIKKDLYDIKKIQ